MNDQTHLTANKVRADMDAVQSFIVAVGDFITHFNCRADTGIRKIPCCPND
jgi:hypothetical protein